MFDIKGPAKCGIAPSTCHCVDHSLACPVGIVLERGPSLKGKLLAALMIV